MSSGETAAGLARAVLQLADTGGMPDSYWQTDSRIRLTVRYSASLTMAGTPMTTSGRLMNEIKPGQVPDDPVQLAVSAYNDDYDDGVIDYPEDVEAMRRALAAVLTKARDQIADWPSREQVMTNAEMTGAVP